MKCVISTPLMEETAFDRFVKMSPAERKACQVPFTEPRVRTSGRKHIQIISPNADIPKKKPSKKQEESMRVRNYFTNYYTYINVICTKLYRYNHISLFYRNTSTTNFLVGEAVK